MLQSQPRINEQFPAAEVERKREFSVFTALELLAQPTSELETKSILNQSIPGRFPNAQTGGRKVR
jgi:hypothetical protein